MSQMCGGERVHPSLKRFPTIDCIFTSLVKKDILNYWSDDNLTVSSPVYLHPPQDANLRNDIHSGTVTKHYF